MTQFDDPETQGGGARAVGILVEDEGQMFLADSADVPVGDDLREFRLADRR
ncbi:MAG: hypothetical protein LBO20_05455 [Bifidobacteriaceae bacterium]|jgi:hypothetical protein|nr:hypothetical protein [Bifidobacteriaceae bacterium]